jgi:hypothetical protein
VTVFTAPAVLALVIGPMCGGVPADSDLTRHLVATVMTESAGTNTPSALTQTRPVTYQPAR